MKTTIIIAFCLCSTLAFSQDRLSRIGGYMSAPEKPTQESVVKALSVASPIALKATAEQFERHCLDRATLDADAQAVYVASPDGFTRQSGIGNTYVKIMQRISKGFFLASAGERFIAIRSESDNLMDDSTYSMPLADTGETYAYTTVLGAGKRVAIYAIRPAVTKAQTLARFKAGDAFLLPLPKTTTTPCINCDGGGFVTVKDGPGGARKTLCPACHGKRNVTLTCDLIHSVYIDKPVATAETAFK